MLSIIAENIWVEGRPLRFMGVETGTRMTVIRLSDGGLFIHSPVSLNPELQREVDALGTVKAIVAPSRFHHLSVGMWMQAYPNAVVCACPGLPEKRTDLRWDRVLTDEPEKEWQGELEQVFFSARPLENEVVFFHSRSRTLVCADLLFNLSHHTSWFTRFVAFLFGNWKPGPTWLERFLMKDRAAARQQVDRMLAWNPERIILAHGDLVEKDGCEVLRRAYAWL